MSPDARARWERVETLLDDALDLGPADRAALLEQARRDNPDAAVQLESMLRAIDPADRFLRQPAQELAAGLIASVTAQGRPDVITNAPPIVRVGPYRLQRTRGSPRAPGRTMNPAELDRAARCAGQLS